MFYQDLRPRGPLPRTIMPPPGKIEGIVNATAEEQVSA